MIVFRLNREKYKDDLSGKGSEIAGGRWNSIGTALLYTSENRALCTTEVAVHLPLGIVPQDYYLTTIQILGKYKIKEIKTNDLPQKWRGFPYSKKTRTIGDNFVKQNNPLILKVPSAAVQGEFNYLINPGHPNFNNVTIVKTELFRFDKRLFKK